MKNIDQDIKSHSFKSSYLISGDEGYLKRFYSDKLSKAIGNLDDSMNTATYSGKDIDIPSLVDLATTLPFLAEKRLILIKESGLFKGSVDDRLVDYIKAPSEDTVIIFVENEIDKRSRLYKAVKDAGYCAELNTPDERTLKVWIKQYFKENGLAIADNDIIYFVERVGSSMELLRNESDKIIAYVGDKGLIERSDIDAITNKAITAQVFDMTDAIAAKNLKLAMDKYADLIAMKEAPLMILFMITRMFRQLYEVKTFTGSDMDKVLGLHPFVAKKYAGIARAFTKEDLYMAMEYGAELEMMVKTGQIQDKYSVELFIVRLCSKEM